MTAPTCPCGGPILAAIYSEQPNARCSWCPSCGEGFVIRRESWELRLAPSRANDIHGKPTLWWEGRLLPSGSVVLTVEGVGAEEDLVRLTRDVLHLSYEADQRGKMLRGADRWAFRREGDGYVSVYGDATCPLVSWRCRGRRPGSTGRVPRELPCQSCRRGLGKGAAGYRGTAEHRSARFCAACVESAPVVGRAELRAVATERTSAP